MLRIIALASFATLLALSGCASLENSGNATYTVSPFVLPSGATVCCSLSVKDGKERQSLEAHITKRGDDYTVDLKEQGVAAFRGQEISAGALTSAVDSAVRAALIPFGAPVLGSGLQLLK